MMLFMMKMLKIFGRMQNLLFKPPLAVAIAAGAASAARDVGAAAIAAGAVGGGQWWRR